MDVVLALLIIGSLVAMVVGLAKPSAVIRWGDRKTRPMVLLVYGGLFLAFFVAMGMVGGKAVPTTATPQKVEQKAKTEEAKTASADVKYTYDDAKKRLADWLGDHMFENVTSIKLSDGPTDGSMYKLEGKEYHLIIMRGFPKAVDILVDPKTGEMFFHDIGVTQPLEKWYFEYRKTHEAGGSQQGGKIDKKSEWVQMPKVENIDYSQYIVGVVKNVSRDSYSAMIVFTLYDAQGNQIGSASDIINNIKPGSTWKFKAPVIGNNVAKYELDGIRYN